MCAEVDACCAPHACGLTSLAGAALPRAKRQWSGGVFRWCFRAERSVRLLLARTRWGVRSGERWRPLR
eukprot:scaffold189_cov249-Pinguiococcus_pyrenoidosus.AAC.17